MCCAALCENGTLSVQTSNPYHHGSSAGGATEEGEISNDKQLAASLAQVGTCINQLHPSAMECFFYTCQNSRMQPSMAKVSKFLS